MAILAAWTLTAALASTPNLIYTVPPPRMRTYPVAGKSLEELLEACRLLGPTDTEGQRFPGLTRYAFHTHYRYDYKVEDGLAIIRLNELAVDWTHEITLPTLAPGVRLPAREAARWKQFLDRLQAHEEAHLGITSDPRLKERFKTIAQSHRVLYKPVGPSGGVTPDEVQAVIDQAIQPAIQRISSQIARRNREFDAATDHGLKPEGLDVDQFFADLWEER
jgi:predicted secreted Zn-dependent protease